MMVEGERIGSSVEKGDIEERVRLRIVLLLGDILVKEKGERRGENWVKEMLAVSRLAPMLLRKEMMKKEALRIFMEETGKRWAGDRDYPDWVRRVFRNRVAEGEMIDEAVSDICCRYLSGEEEPRFNGTLMFEEASEGEVFSFNYNKIVEKLNRDLEKMKDDIYLFIETLKGEALARGQDEVYVVQDLKKVDVIRQYCLAYLEVEKRLIGLLKMAHNIGIEGEGEAAKKRREWVERMVKDMGAAGR